MMSAPERGPGWGYALAAAIVFPLVGPAGPVALTAIPFAILGLLSLGPGGVLYAVLLAAFWLPAAYMLFAAPLLIAGILHGLAARLTGRARLWTAAVAAEVGFGLWFGGLALLPGGVEAFAPTYMPMWQGVRQNPAAIVGILLSASFCWWVLRRMARHRSPWASGTTARMSRREQAIAAVAILAGGFACAGILNAISDSPETAWKDCMESASSDQLRGCPVIAASADQPTGRRALASYRLGNARQAHNDLPAAIAAYSEAIRFDPALAAAYAARALVKDRGGQQRLVIADVDEALRLDPNLGNASRLYRARGQAHLAAGRPDLAVADHTEEFRLTPRYADGLLNRARAHLARQDPQSAIADAEAGIRLESFHPRGYTARGLAHLQAGQDDEALRDFDEAISKMPNVVVAVLAYLKRAGIREGRGDRAGALADYEKALSLRPGNPEAAAGRERLRASTSPPGPAR